MMKWLKYIVPASLFVLVFAVSAIFMGHTLMRQEALGLFLLTPDWFREVFAEPFPLSHIVGGFLVQFYRLPLAGPLITALLVVAVYCMSERVHRLFEAPEFPAALFAGIVWFLSATLDKVSFLPAVLLMMLPIWLVSLLFQPKPSAVRKPSFVLLPLAAVLAAAIVIAVNPTVRSNERWSIVEDATRQHQWSKVLKVATPETVSKDREMLPYALLALNAQGKLLQSMERYGASSPEDLDQAGVQTRRGYFFESVLYEVLGCPQESIHLMFQSACHLPHGTSFMTLRQLIRYNIETGNYTMVRKYCGILGRSPVNRSTARSIMAMYGDREDVVRDEPADSAATITNNPIFNLIVLDRQGIRSDIATDRFNAYSLVAR